jgi:MFS family permease
VPLSIRLGFGYFFVVRILQGVSFAAIYPIIGLVTENWALSINEHGVFLAILTGFSQLAQIYSIPLSGN